MTSNTVLTVYRGFPPTNAYSWSPFVTKLEARLRFASQPYTLGFGSPKSAPRGKIPYVETEAGDKLGDSTLIIRQLVSAGQLPDLNETLTPGHRAQDLAFRALLEDKLYFYGGKERWVDNYTTMREGVLAPVPWPLRPIIGFFAQRAAVRTLYGQGAGRLSDEEVATFRDEVWDNITTLLEEAKHNKNSKATGKVEPFWMLGGEAPTEADAVLYGFIVATNVCEA